MLRTSLLSCANLIPHSHFWANLCNFLHCVCHSRFWISALNNLSLHQIYLNQYAMFGSKMSTSIKITLGKSSRQQKYTLWIFSLFSIRKSSFKEASRWTVVPNITSQDHKIENWKKWRLVRAFLLSTSAVQIHSHLSKLCYGDKQWELLGHQRWKARLTMFNKI